MVVALDFASAGPSMTAAQAKVSVPGWALQGVVGYARAGAPGLVAGVVWLGTF